MTAIDIIMIILSLIDIGLVIGFIRFFVKLRRMINLYDDTTIKIDKLGYLMAVFGEVRIGKTSFTSGLVHYLEKRKIINNLITIMQDVVTTMHFIDFNDVDKLININSDLSLEKITNIILKLIHVAGYTSDFLSNKRYEDLLKNYIEAYYNLNLRGVFVKSKTFFYSRNTRKKALYLDPKSLEMRNLPKNNNFNCEKDYVYIEDELSLEKGKVKSNIKAEKLSGRKETKALWGHLYEERSYWIQIKQIADDEIKVERDLSQKHIEIIERKIFPCYGFLKKYFRVYLNAKNILAIFKYKLSLFLTKKKNRYLKQEILDKSVSRYRKKEYELQKINKYLDSLSFIGYHIKIYNRVEDVGKVDEKYFTEDVFYFPLKDCYGTYNTHEYAALGLVLKEKYGSDIVEKEIPFFKTYEKGMLQYDLIFEVTKESGGDEVDDF